MKLIVPDLIKRQARTRIQDRALGRALKAIAKLPAGELPCTTLLKDLSVAWDNDGMAAETEYLLEVSRRALSTKGPVLECGSGLTTLLLGLLAGSRGVEVWTFEHHPAWHQRVLRTLSRHRIHAVNNFLTPLTSYGDFSWYDPPKNRLPNSFSLVVCDGPPGDTPGGRYGLMPVMHASLQPGSVILLDDAQRESESTAMKKWQEFCKLNISIHAQAGGQFAVIEIVRTL